MDKAKNKKETIDMIEQMIQIIESEPLGYKTEEEHKKLENFANRCISKMRLEQLQYEDKEFLDKLRESLIDKGVTNEEAHKNLRKLYPYSSESKDIVVNSIYG